MDNTKPRIITLDIETSPIVSYTWGTWQQDVGIEQIKEEWTVLSFAVKVLGEDKVTFRHTGGRGRKKVRDDKELLEQLWKILDSADIVIAQNGKQFDLKKINARMAMHHMKPYSPVRVIDTLETAKKHFAFTSNRLAWTSKHLTDTKKSEHKKFPGFELWLECLADNPSAWREMKKYNCQDVRATEKVYLRLRPWMKSHPNLSLYTKEKDVVECPSCGSNHVHKKGVTTTNGGQYQRWICVDCGTNSRSKVNLIPSSKRKTTLVTI